MPSNYFRCLRERLVIIAILSVLFTIPFVGKIDLQRRLASIRDSSRGKGNPDICICIVAPNSFPVYFLYRTYCHDLLVTPIHTIIT